MKFLAALIFSFLAATSLAANTGYAEAKAQADKDEASLGQNSGPLIESQGQVLAPLLASCGTSVGTGDLSDFVVVMKLDASGRIVQTWRQGGSPISACFEKSAMGKTLAAPPRAPFYTSFEMHFTH